jgi:hypothetical protein
MTMLALRLYESINRGARAMSKEKRKYTDHVKAKRSHDTPFAQEVDAVATAETYCAMHTDQRYVTASMLIAMIVIGIEEKWFAVVSDVGVAGAKYQRFKGSKENPAAHVLPRMILVGKQALSELPWPDGVKACLVSLFDECGAPPTVSNAASTLTPAYFNELDSKLERNGQVEAFQSAIQMAVDFRRGNAIAHIEQCMKKLAEGYRIAFLTTINRLTQPLQSTTKPKFDREVLTKIAREGHLEQEHIAKWYPAKVAYEEAKGLLDLRAPDRVQKSKSKTNRT